MKREDLEQALELLDDDLIERAGNRTGLRSGPGEAVEGTASGIWRSRLVWCWF